MPDAAGNIKGIALSGKAGEVLERIKRQEELADCQWHPGVKATHDICGEKACIDCWEKAYNLD